MRERHYSIAYFDDQRETTTTRVCAMRVFYPIRSFRCLQSLLPRSKPLPDTRALADDDTALSLSRLHRLHPILCVLPQAPVTRSPAAVLVCSLLVNPHRCEGRILCRGVFRCLTAAHSIAATVCRAIGPFQPSRIHTSA